MTPSKSAIHSPHSDRPQRDCCPADTFETRLHHRKLFSPVAASQLTEHSSTRWLRMATARRQPRTARQPSTQIVAADLRPQIGANLINVLAGDRRQLTSKRCNELLLSDHMEKKREPPMMLCLSGTFEKV